MAEMKTSTVESLLGVLSLGPMSGYEMRQFMAKSTANFWSESFGQIYPALKKMLADGLVEVDEQGGDGRPVKKVYRITEAGLERLRHWLRLPVKPQKSRHELLLKVFFGSQAERGVIAAQVEVWRERYAADLERYVEIEKELSGPHARKAGQPFFLITVRYGITEAKALMRWCDETMAELERMGLGYQAAGRREWFVVSGGGDA